MEEAAYLERLRALWAAHWPAGMARAPLYPLGEIPLSEMLRERARRHPDRPAVIFYGAALSYAALDRLSDRFAALLVAEGVRPGDRVAVFLPTCPQFHVAFFGILKARAVHVPVNPLFREQELLYELEDTGAEVIVAQDQLMPLLRSVRDRTPLRRVFVTSIAETLPEAPAIPIPDSIAAPRIPCPDAVDLLPAIASCDAPVPREVPDLDAIAALNYTGGTTGMPKGCIHTQRDMVHTAATYAARIPGGAAEAEREVHLNFFPLFWIAGENLGLVFPVFCGATLVELARWDPLGWMAAVERYRANDACLLVDNAVAVMDHPDAARFDLRSLRRVGCASFVKKLNLDYRRRWQALTGTVMAEVAWGMTETHTHDTFTTGLQQEDFDLHQQPIFVGLPTPGTEFAIRDFDTGALVPLGAEGEITVRTPSLFKGYWRRPEATAAAIREGWFHTGDIGLLDERGFLHFLGRRKEMLKVNGMSVFPAEIEAMLGRHPAVIGSAVIGRPDERRGQVPVAFLLLDPARRAAWPTAAAMAEWCRASMATYKVPEIRIVESLPMTATGKVKKEELARLLDTAS